MLRLRYFAFLLFAPLVFGESTDFAFDQCECQDESFAPVEQGVSEFSPFVPDNPSALLCGSGAPGFPDAPGVQIQGFGTVLKSNIANSFFVDGLTPKSFVMTFSISTAGQNAGDFKILARMRLASNSALDISIRDGLLELLENGNRRAFFNNFVVGEDAFVGFVFDSVSGLASLCFGDTADDMLCQLGDTLADNDFDDFGVLELLERTGNSPDVTLRRMRLENDLDATDATSIVREVAGRMGITDTVPIVIFTDFESVENTPVTVDVSTALSEAPAELIINVDEESLEFFGQILDGPDNGVFTFLPDLNLVDSSPFTVDYGIGTCFNNGVIFTLTTIANSLPVPEDNIVVEAFAAATVKKTEFVVTDTDFEQNILPTGEFELIQVPADVTFLGVEQNGDCGAQEVSQLDIVNSEITFCIAAEADFFEGEVTVDFDVRDLQGGEVRGSLTVTGAPPIAVLADTIIEMEEDDDDFGVIIGQALGENLAEDDGDFSIKLISFPDLSLGEVLVQSGESTTLAVEDQVISRQDSVAFRPVPDTFNSFNGGPEGADGEPIGVCANNERVNGFCPIQIVFSAVLGDFESVETGVIDVFVDAVDDGGEEIVAAAELVAVFGTVGDARLDASLPRLRVRSDLNETVFPLRLSLSAAGGATFRFGGVQLDRLKDNLNLVEEQPLSADGTPVQDCSVAACSSAFYTGTAPVLESLFILATIEIDLLEENLNPQVTFSIGNSNEAVVFDVTLEEPEFFDSNTNVAIVAGLGTGLVALIAGIAYFRLRERDNKITDNVLKQAEENVKDEIARGKVRSPTAPKGSGKKGSSKKSKKAPSVEDMGGGWEKHFDESSKEHFYYNPATEETTWQRPAALDI